MGYSASATCTNVIIPKRHLAAALAALIAADAGRAGDDLETIVKEIGFKSALNREGDLEFGYFEYGKIGEWVDDGIEALLPFFLPGAQIDWVGEDSEYWRWVFDGKEQRTFSGGVTYDNDLPALALDLSQTFILNAALKIFIKSLKPTDETTKAQLQQAKALLGSSIKVITATP